IEFTSFVESQNACLKHIIESSNTSLYELRKVLIDSAKDTIKQKQYKDLTRGVNLMKESVFYILFRSNIEKIQNMSINKLSDSDNFEDEPDSDYEFVEIVKTYLASVYEKEIISQQVENLEEEDSDKENTLPNTFFYHQAIIYLLDVDFVDYYDG
ncbi:7500_t:CDS:2, partial [Dentiscutata erythropus]